MDDRSVIELNPEISADNQKVFIRFRLLAIASLLLAMFAAAFFAG